MFWYFYVNKWPKTKQFAKENMFDYCEWREYDVKTSFFFKSNGVAEFNDQQKGFYLNKIIVFGVFCHNDYHGTMDNA